MPFVEKTARALIALHEKGFLKDPDFKEPVTRFIRNASETTHWNLTTHYQSRAAATLIREAAPATPAQFQSFCKTRLAHEHVVPDAFVYKTICAEPNITLEYLQATLRRFGIRATILREEDKAFLSRDGLRSGMPPCYFDPDHLFYQDPLARYKVSGLYARLVKRKGESWWPLPATDPAEDSIAWSLRVTKPAPLEPIISNA